MPMPARRRSREEEPSSAPEAAAQDAPEAASSAEGAGPAPAAEQPPRRARRAAAGAGDGLKEFLTAFYRVSRIVFLLLALACALGVVFVLAPTNEDNSVVQLVNDVAEGAAGPFKDVFTADERDRELVINYGFAALVYLVASALVTKLPGGKR